MVKSVTPVKKTITKRTSPAVKTVPTSHKAKPDKVKKTPLAPSKATQNKAVRVAKAPKSLFAVFATGGKQYRVSVGDLVKIEKLSDPSRRATYKEGDKIVFDTVLLVDDGKSEVTIGTPFVKGAKIVTSLNKIARYKTIDVIKYKAKSRYFKKYGHRQPYFEIKISSIT